MDSDSYRCRWCNRLAGDNCCYCLVERMAMIKANPISMRFTACSRTILLRRRNSLVVLRVYSDCSHNLLNVPTSILSGMWRSASAFMCILVSSFMSAKLYFWFVCCFPSVPTQADTWISAGPISKKAWFCQIPSAVMTFFGTMWHI